MDLRAALRERGHRQRDLAVRLGVTEPTVSRWVAWARDRETGVPIPAEVLPVVSEMTGLSPAALRPDLAKLFEAA
jgi:DNA-binding transcriptional regulator YdaS (Cro superfamily)